MLCGRVKTVGVRTDRPTNRRTNKAAFRVACTQIRMHQKAASRSLSPQKCNANILRTSSFQCMVISKPKGCTHTVVFPSFLPLKTSASGKTLLCPMQFYPKCTLLVFSFFFSLIDVFSAFLTDFNL